MLETIHMILLFENSSFEKASKNLLALYFLAHNTLGIEVPVSIFYVSLK